MQKSYHITSDEGDIVLMPNGTIGIINQMEILLGGNCKGVRVYPFTNWLHRLFLTLTCKIWFYDRQINNLKPLHLAPRL